MMFEIKRHPEAFSVDRAKRQRDPRKTSDTHLRWIRTLPSLVKGTGPVEAAHVRFASPRYGKRHTGKAEKPHDKWTVPLSAEQHRLQHTMDEEAYWALVGIDPLFVAVMLWNVSGDDEEAARIIAHARTERATP